MDAFVLEYRGDHGSMHWSRPGFSLMLRTDELPKPTYSVTLLMDIATQRRCLVMAGQSTLLLPEVRTRSYMLAFYLMTWFLQLVRHESDDTVARQWLKRCESLPSAHDGEGSTYRMKAW